MRCSLLILLFIAAASACDAEPAAHPRMGLVTLYAYDDSRQTYSFADAAFGHVVRHSRVYNKSSQIGFHRWQPDSLSVNIQAGDVASIFTLADVRDTETGVSLYHGITRVDDCFTWKSDAYASSLDLSALPTTEELTVQSLPVSLGSIYLLRIRKVSAAGEGAPLLLVKLRVIDHAPARYVAFVWELL